MCTLNFFPFHYYSVLRRVRAPIRESLFRRSRTRVRQIIVRAIYIRYVVFFYFLPNVYVHRKIMSVTKTGRRAMWSRVVPVYKISSPVVSFFCPASSPYSRTHVSKVRLVRSRRLFFPAGISRQTVFRNAEVALANSVANRPDTDKSHECSAGAKFWHSIETDGLEKTKQNGTIRTIFDKSDSAKRLTRRLLQTPFPTV